MSAAPVDRETRQDIADLFVRYANAIDQRDWDTLRACFTEDCDADYGAIGHWRSADEITEWMRVTHEPLGTTLHRITNQQVTSVGPVGATARAYIDALVMFPGGKTGTRATGFYDDELVRADDGWKVARRRFTTVLMLLVPDGTVLDLDPPG
jgi:3-phenylpropionate/cinnamic acid dioxygenase small subunit